MKLIGPACPFGVSLLSGRVASLVAASGSLLLVGASPAAHSEAAEGEVIEELVVVGSQIRGARITGALPVSVIGTEEIMATGAVSADELFRAIPEAGDITFTGNFLSGTNSNAVRGDISTVSLRGLPQGNTLLLLNGRRSVEHPTSQTDNGTPVFGYNVNALPVKGLARVEILKDGAAALYGSDAVAGVVNNVLRSDYEGFELDVQYGSAEFDEWTTNAAWGTNFAQGKGNFSIFGGVTDRDPLLVTDHDYTRFSDLRPLVEGTPFEGNVAFDNRSTQGPWGGFQARDATGAPLQVTSGGVPVTDAGGNFIVQPAALGGCTYELDGGLCYGGGTVLTGARRPLRSEWRGYPGFTTLPGVRRENVFSFLNYEFDNGLEFFGELGYYQAESDAVSSAPSSLGSTPIFIPADAYWNPFGPVGSPNRLPDLNIPDEGVPLQIRNYAFHEGGPRDVKVENMQYRILGGLRGEAFGWSWESALLYNRAEVKDTQDHAASDLVQQALALTTPDAYNPFAGGNLDDWTDIDPVSANSPETVRSFMTQAVRENTTELTLWDFKVSRADLFRLPAGGLGIAAGIEWRQHTYDDDRDLRQDTSTPYVDVVFGDVYESSLMGHSPSRDVDGERDVFSAFVEFGVPVISPEMEIPLVEAFDLQFAGRFEDYSDVGSVGRPKVAGSWDVVPGLRLRSSWSEGFKAPNLDVLNTPVLERLNGRTDYYACEADLRAGRIATFADCTRSYGVPGLRQGNPDLEPEESESFSYGVVFEPMFLPEGFGQLIVTVDRWSLEQTGIIGVLDEQQAIDLDYLFRLRGSTNPNVIRAAPTPAEIASFAGTGLEPAGEILGVNAAFTNLLPLELSGVDVGVVYNNFWDGFGDLSVSLNVSHIDEFFQSPAPPQQILIDAAASGELNEGVPVTGAADLRQENGNPELRWTLSATWSKGPWQVGYLTQFIDEVLQPGILDANANPWVVDSLQTHNLYAQFRTERIWKGASTFRIGARNLTDEDPPIADDGTGAFLGSIHQPVGRYVYGSISFAL
ncbi:MAG: TonB-dependent receptor [Pseudomonadales bacterium]|jgi:outer membrane receptor protein involved in Fe transport|nr:TonB-dependent receptor [Pseudomonadales bacterium]